MANAIGPAIIGIILVVLGISNMRGNISSIHSYHRKRVSEEDKKPFGKLVGMGTLMIGAALIVFGALNYAAEQSGRGVLTVIGAALLVIAIVVGLGISLYAMIKYNKGIF